MWFGQVTWSFVKLEYYPDELLDSVARVLAQRSPQFDGKAVSNILWALARRGPGPGVEAMLKAVAADLTTRSKVGWAACIIAISIWCDYSELAMRGISARNALWTGTIGTLSVQN